jgi:hypothetical protein
MIWFACLERFMRARPTHAVINETCTGEAGALTPEIKLLIGFRRVIREAKSNLISLVDSEK